MSENASAASRPGWKAFVLALLIVVFGIGIGASGTVLILRNVVLYRLHHPQETDVWLTQMTARALRLTPSEQEQVARLFSKHMKELNRIRLETYPRVNQLLDEMRDEVAGVLDAGKAGEWRKRFERIRGTWMLPPPSPAYESGAARDTSKN